MLYLFISKSKKETKHSFKNKMPCQFCQSYDHTLSRCDSEIAITMCNDVIVTYRENPYKIMNFIKFLQNYLKPELSVVCRRMGMNITGTKSELIFGIVEYLFREKTRMSMLQFVSLRELSIIDEEYTYAYYMWRPTHNENRLRENVIVMLEKFYLRAYGIRRNGHSLENYLQIVTEWAIHEITQIRQRQRQESESKTHLKKLEFQIKIDPDPSLEVEECCICCENKPIAKLGCSHEYCVDCIYNSAKVRTKSFITCAMCRSEINEVHVTNIEIQKNLVEKISVV